MFSRLRAFRNGRAAWSVTHDPDLDVRGVTVHGEPPAIFEDVHGRLAAEAAADATGDVDHMFEAPIQLGEKLCGYSHDRPASGGWINLDPSSQPQVAPATPRLPMAFRSELLPRLEASGWSFAGEYSHFHIGEHTGEWSFERVRDQCREDLRLGWAERGGYGQLEASFHVWESATHEGDPLIVGETRAVRPSERPTGKSLWRWIVELYFGRAPARQDPMTELLARVREDLAAIETFLATGHADRRLLIRGGSAAPV